MDYFCGPGVKPEGSGWSCPDITVNVDNIYPQDDGIKRIYNEQVLQAQEQKLAEAQKKTNQADLEAAKARYGDQAEFFLGLIDACKAGGCPGSVQSLRQAAGN